MQSSSSSSSSSTWRFSMELLSHVHTLRVHLIPSSSEVCPAEDLTSLEASLLSAPPALSCSWKVVPEAATRSLRLSLPLLLFDYSSSPYISTLFDSIQVTLHLLPFPPLGLDLLSSLQAREAALPRNDRKCTASDSDGPAQAINGTRREFSFRSSAEDVMHRRNPSLQSHDHDCAQTTTLPTDADTNAGVSGKEQKCNEGTKVRLFREDNNCDGFTNSKTNVLKAVKDENLQQSTKCDGNQQIAGSTSNSAFSAHSSDRLEMSRREERELCPSISHSPENDGFLDQYTYERSPRDQQTKHPSPDDHQTEGESPIHGHSMQSTGDTECCEPSSSCQHQQATRKLYRPLDSFATDIFPLKQGLRDQSAQGIATFVCKNCLNEVSRKPVRDFLRLPCFDWREVAENWFGACCCSFGSVAEALSVNFEKSIQLQPGKCLVGPSTFYLEFSDVIVKDDCDSSSIDRKRRQWPTSYFLAFGNGFMVWENQVSKLIKWISVRCLSCSSLIGAYPSPSSDADTLKEGLHLFRCQVKTVYQGGILNDKHSVKTFKDLIVDELKIRTDENSTYRFLIRSLCSEKPLLQIVVLKYDALISKGRVTIDVKQNAHSIGELTSLDTDVRLQESIKVLFLDCTKSEGDLGSIGLWVEQHDAETVYMVEEFVDMLREELLANSNFCPDACGLFQGFTSSFLYTMQK